MKKVIFVWVLSLIVLSSISVSSQTVPKDTSQVVQNILKLEAQHDTLKMEFEKVKKESYEKAMENAKANMDLASLLIKGVGLIVAIMTGLGIFSYIRAGQTREKVEKEIEEIRKLKGDANQEMNKTVSLRNDIENTKKEAANLIKDIERIYEDVKKRGVEIEKAGKQIEESKRSIEDSKTEVSAISYFTEGNRFLDQKEYDKAIEKYREAIELNPDYAEAYINWGVALGDLGRHNEAIEKYKKATELRPDHATAYYNWGCDLGKLGRPEEAIQKYKKAIELKPNYAAAWFNLACASALQNKKKEALENLKKAIEFGPKYNKHYKEQAKEDEDFKNLWEDEEFKKLVG